MLKTLFQFLAATAFCAQAALAGSGMPDKVAEFDILPGWRTETGTHMTALRIRLAPGWKTYWRAPGEAGIPPRFDWQGSRNLAAVLFHWPVPSVFSQNGMRTVGYADELILPIELTPARRGGPITLRAEIELGVCETVCVPIEARVAADIGTSGARDARIVSALARRPHSADEAGLRAVRCRVEPIRDGLRLTAHIEMPSLSAGEIAIFELPDPEVWVSEAEARRDGGTLVARADMVPPSNAPFLLDRSQVRITVLGRGQAVDIWGCTS